MHAERTTPSGPARWSGKPIRSDASVTNAGCTNLIAASKMRNATGRPDRTRPAQRATVPGVFWLETSGIEVACITVFVSFVKATNDRPPDRQQIEKKLALDPHGSA